MPIRMVTGVSSLILITLSERSCHITVNTLNRNTQYCPRTGPGGQRCRAGGMAIRVDNKSVPLALTGPASISK